jgi:uncharacterized membrane protein YeaQ/YmgE (transglycosylase-associated protein family)
VVTLVALLLLCVFFIVCRRYEDGLIGNLALGVVGTVAFLMLLSALHGDLQLPPPEVYVLIVSMTVFMVRHAYRFAMFHWHGHFGWGKPRDFDPDATTRMKALGPQHATD